MEESANGIRPVRRPLLFSTAGREWMAANQARWSKSNVSTQEFNLKHLNKHFGPFLLVDITPEHIGKYQGLRQKQNASNRTINMEVSTLRMIMKAAKLWSAIADDVKMLSERRDVGRALSPEEETKLLEACRKSPQPSLYTAVVIFCNTGLRNAELRRARWSQVDFMKAEFKVGKAKTEGSEGRIVPLNQAALAGFKDWRARWPDAKPTDYIFPSEKLVFKGEGAAERGIMTSYDADPDKPLGAWKRAWTSAKKAAGVECRIHDLRHHFISALAQTQTTDATIQAITGHLSRKMLEHYSHVRLEAKRRAVEALDAMAGPVQ
jgi:integrase